jgi:hypothetical protein
LRKERETVEEDERLRHAKERVEEIKGFYIHLGVYVIINAALFAINMITNPDALWFYWPMIGWGIGLAIHLFAFLAEGRLFGPEWEKKKIRELMDR